MIQPVALLIDMIFVIDTRGAMGHETSCMILEVYDQVRSLCKTAMASKTFKQIILQIPDPSSPWLVGQVLILASAVSRRRGC